MSMTYNELKKECKRHGIIGYSNKLNCSSS